MSLIAAAAAALISVLDPFDHGAWLVAYLFLVGFLAQLLLGRGQAALVAADGAAGVRLGLQAALWNAGVVLVPLGVLVDARLFVVLGGVALLAALTCFLRVARRTRTPSERDSSRLRGAQLVLIAFMAFSVLAGTALAWDTPWL